MKQKPRKRRDKAAVVQALFNDKCTLEVMLITSGRGSFATCDEEGEGEGDGEVEGGHAEGDDLPEARHTVQPQLQQAAQARQTQERH